MGIFDANIVKNIFFVFKRGNNKPESNIEIATRKAEEEVTQYINKTNFEFTHQIESMDINDNEIPTSPLNNIEEFRKERIEYWLNKLNRR